MRIGDSFADQFPARTTGAIESETSPILHSNLEKWLYFFYKSTYFAKYFDFLKLFRYSIVRPRFKPGHKVWEKHADKDGYAQPKGRTGAADFGWNRIGSIANRHSPLSLATEHSFANGRSA
jgi:hypothetical protein